MTKVFCVLEDGGAIPVTLEADWTTADLKLAVKQLANPALAAYPAHLLTLRLAKKGKEWLQRGDEEFAHLGNGFSHKKVATILNHPDNVMDQFKSLSEFNFPKENTSATQVHVLVKTPDCLGAVPAPPQASAVAAQTTTASLASQESKEEDPLLGPRVGTSLLLNIRLGSVGWSIHPDDIAVPSALRSSFDELIAP